jgi:hypothetical protein
VSVCSRIALFLRLGCTRQAGYSSGEVPKSDVNGHLDWDLVFHVEFTKLLSIYTTIARGTDTERIKYTNIIINGTITILLAITTQYKIHDRISMFKSYQSKFTKLNHHIKSLLNSKKDNEISNEEIVSIVSKYDSLVDELSFTYPNHIRTIIIIKYQNANITFPNSLQLDSSIVIVNVA